MAEKGEFAVKPVKLKRAMVFWSFWLATLVILVAEIRGEPVPEGVATILSSMFGIAIVVYGGSQAVVRREEIKKNGQTQELD